MKINFENCTAARFDGDDQIVIIAPNKAALTRVLKAIGIPFTTKEFSKVKITKA